MLPLRNISTVSTAQHEHRVAVPTRSDRAAAQVISYEASSSGMSNTFSGRDSHERFNQAVWDRRASISDIQRRRISAQMDKRDLPLFRQSAFDTALSSATKEFGKSFSLEENLLKNRGRKLSLPFISDKGKAIEGHALSSKRYDEKSLLLSLLPDQKILSDVCETFDNHIVRVDSDGLIMQVEDPLTGEVRLATSNETAIHQQSMEILENLDFFNKPFYLLKTGVLAEDACDVLTRASEEALPFLLAGLELKREVGILLTISPSLYQKLNNVYSVYDYLVTQSPFDSSELRHTLFSALERGEGELLETGAISRRNSAKEISELFSEKQIALNHAYKHGLEQLIEAEQQFKERLYSPALDDASVVEYAENLQKIPAQYDEERKAVMHEARAHLIAIISTEIRHYLTVLTQAMAEIERCGGSCFVPGADSAADVEKEVNLYLAKLDKKIEVHLAGSHNLIGQKKVKFSELLTFFDKCRLLPSNDALDDLSIIPTLTEKLETVLAIISKQSQAWALDNITYVLKEEYGTADGAQEEAKMQQIGYASAIEQRIEKKLSTTGELPLFSGRGSEHLEELVDFLETSGLVYDRIDDSSNNVNEAIKNSLQALVKANLVSPIIYEEIMEAPTYMQPFLMKSLDIKKTLAAQLLSNPTLIDDLQTIQELHDYLVNEMAFDVEAARLNDINSFEVLDKKLSLYLTPTQRQLNQIYRDSFKAIDDAEKNYRQALFGEPFLSELSELASSPRAGAMCAWDYAAQLKHVPKEIARHSDVYQHFVDERERVLRHIIGAVGVYISTVEEVLNKIEENQGQLAFTSAAVFSKRVTECQKQFEHYAQRHFSQERNLFGIKKTSFSDLLHFLEEVDFLPLENNAQDRSPCLLSIQTQLDEVNQYVKRYADEWARKASATALSQNLAVDELDGNEVMVGVEHSAQGLLQQHKMGLQNMKQAVEQKIEELKREEIQRLAAEAKRESGGSLMGAFMYAHSAIMAANAEYQHSVDYARYRHAVADIPDTQSRAYSGPNPYFFADILHTVHAAHAYQQSRSTAADNLPVQAQQPEPQESSQALSSQTRDAFTDQLDRRVARNNLCTSLHLNQGTDDRSLDQAYRRRLREIHPDKSMHLDSVARQRHVAESVRLISLNNTFRGAFSSI